MKFKKFSLAACLGLAATGLSNAAVIPVTADITADATWTADNIYTIGDAIFVKNNATLTIEPGTVIAGSNDGTNFGSLVVTRGSKLEAEGTASRPIIFTATAQAEFYTGQDIDGDTLVNTTPLDPYDPIDTTFNPLAKGGYWGGIILLGNAPVNFYDGLVPDTPSIEGFPGGSSDLEFGGTDAADNSGTMRYVSIQFGGFEFATNDEINGLTLGGVGNGTTIECVEVVANTDDGFEFFGGTVNTKNLVSAFNLDESFDIDQGHQGCHQFWFAVQSTSSDNGSELDSTDGSNLSDEQLSPKSLTQIFNATYIGGGSVAGSSNDGFRIKDGFAGEFHNSVFHDFGGHLFRVDDSSTLAEYNAGTLKLNNCTFGNFASGASHGGETVAENGLLAQTGNSAIGTNPQFTTLVRTADEVTEVDPRPATGSPLLSGSLTAISANSCFDEVSYRGAFGDTNWAAGWSYLGTQGLFSNLDVASRSNVVVSGDITTNTTWNKNTNYILEDAIFVKSGATLTIEAGTYIMGTNDGTNFGSLVITRGSDIIANGTADEPIVFTAVKEAEAQFGVDFDSDTNINTVPLDPNDPVDTTFNPLAKGGYWGGVIILGEAPVNFYDDLVPDTPSIEGFPGGSADLEYGGNVAADSSGIMRYVSIQFGGFEFATNNEINGLTLGGVGSGTTIEFVEVVANTDDGFEFFGGTVQTKNLISAFNLDEAFDADQGHTANHQFWYAHQGIGSDNGSELDSTDGSNLSDEQLTPKTLMEVYNATYLGGGPNAGSSNDGFRIKDGWAGEFHNSIFHDFGGYAFRVDDSSALAEYNAGESRFNNNIFGAFASGASHGNETTAENGFLAQTGNTALNTDPCLRGTFLGLDDQRDGVTDPRPRTDSPAWASNGATFTAVPAGLATVNYRGAFGTSNWADGWSYLSKRGILVNCPAGPAGSTDFRQWANDSLTDEILRGPMDSPSGSGLVNFAAYAFGKDPVDATDTDELVATSATGTATFSRLNTAGAPSYEVFISSSLPFGDTPAVLGVDYSEATVANGDYDNVTLTVLVPASGDRFVKVVASDAK